MSHWVHAVDERECSYSKVKNYKLNLLEN